jgi:ribosomal protein L7/L12
MQDAASLSNKCQSLHAEGKSQDEIVSFLRAQGCSKVESIAILAKALGIGLGKAKDVVHFSGAWADTRKRDERFQSSLEESDDGK